MDEERERRLRSLRIERRDQQAELEDVVREADAGRRTLIDVLWEHGERGDRCTVEVGSHTVTGHVRHVGDDIVTVVDAVGRPWDVSAAHIDLVARLEPGAAVHRIRRGHPRTLVARGRELAAGAAFVELGLVGRPHPLRGRLVAASPELAEVDRGAAGPAVVPWRAVAWLSEP